MAVETEKKGFLRRNAVKIIIIATVAIVIVAVMADLNGGSLDFTDRDIRLIVTDSMDGEPTEYPISTIEKDCLVMVKRIHTDSEKSSLTVGDVIQFNYYDMLDHHRLVSNDLSERKVVTKGDNSPVTESVSYDDITGVVVGKNHLLGQLTAFLKIYWVTAIAFILAAMIAVNLIMNIRKGDTE